jgi:hypothetical protein
MGQAQWQPAAALMHVRLDHIFICTTHGAPAAGKLRQFGLTEGSPNTHPGQGTACRRFFFRNFMLELIWIENASDIRSEQTGPTMLWERWSSPGSSPFGIILGQQTGYSNVCPFPAWDYRPQTMADLKVKIASGTALEEPMWCYIERARAPVEAPVERQQPLEHAAGTVVLTGVRLACPALDERSVTRAMADAALIEQRAGAQHLLELQFDHGQMSADFRPDLPLVIRYAAKA